MASFVQAASVPENDSGFAQIPRALWQDATFAASYRRVPVHFCSELYKRRIREMDADLLCTVDACVYSVPKAPSKIKHSNACLEAIAAKTFQKCESTVCYSRELVCHSLSSREHTTKLYWFDVLRVDAACFSKSDLQVQAQGGRFERASKQTENKKALCVVLAPVCTSALINDLRYVSQN